MKTIPIQYNHQPIIIEGNKDCFFWECYAMLQYGMVCYAMLCCFISCTILKPILYHAVPDFNINPNSFMSTEFSVITLLRNILCMSTNQNQEHLINCIKNTRQNFLQKSGESVSSRLQKRPKCWGLYEIYNTWQSMGYKTDEL